jgi:protein TonB
MQIKKNWSQNLENFRGLFFLVGLALTLAAVTEIIEWQTELPVAEKAKGTAVIANSSFVMPITVRDKQEIPEKKDLPKPEPIPKPSDKFKIVDNNQTIVKVKQFIDLSGLDTVGLEAGLGPDVPEAVEAIFVQNMARPKACEALTNKDEQMLCFNRWIKTFIAQETVYPESAVRMREEETVYVKFIINEFGNVEQVEVVRGNNVSLANEALRVVNKLPQLVAAKQLGQPVPVKVVVPVNFKLQ